MDWRTPDPGKPASSFMPSCALGVLFCLSCRTMNPTAGQFEDLVLFTSQVDGNSEIYSMNPDGTDQVRLTTNDVPDVSPSWGRFRR